MELVHPKIKTEDLLFYIAYGIFLIFGILSTSFYYKYFSAVYSLIKYLCIVILIIRELMIHKYNIKSIFIGILFVALIVITRTQSTVATITYILIFLFCARNVDFNGIVRFSAWTSLGVVLFVVASGYIGLIDNFVYQDSTRTRYYLGFRYSLYGPAFMLNITALFIYLKREDIKWLSLFTLMILNYWIFVETDSRFSFGLSIILIFVAGFLKLFPKFFDGKRVLCILMVFSFVICFGISMYFTITYDSSVNWQRQLNNILENRLSLGQSGIQENGITLFGQELNLVGNGLDQEGEQNTTDTYNYVDSFYIQILLRYGIIFMAVWISLLTYTLYYFNKKGDWWFLVCFTVIAVRCILDNLSLELYYCTFWFAIATAVVQFHGNKRKESLNNGT